MQIPAVVEVGGLVESVQGFDDQIFVLGQQSFHLFPAPDIVLALLTFGVRVQSTVETAFRVAHVL